MSRMNEIKEYIKTIKSRFDLGKIEKNLDELKELNVLVVGDTIIDYYLFVNPKGRAMKDPILSVEYVNEEVYPGGVLAVANHISDFVKEVKLVTLIGDRNSMIDFINSSLSKNVKVKMFLKENSPTTIKKRIIDNYRRNKLFKIEYTMDRPILQELTEQILRYLEEELPKYNLVVVSDFGHGFINDEIRRKLEEKSNFLALNSQLNSANIGYNYFNLYKGFDFVSMNTDELRLPLQMRFDDVDSAISEARNRFQMDRFLVTLGNKGSVYVHKGVFFNSPALIGSVKDVVGAGDALFAIASLFVYMEADNDLIPFIANCAGGIAANTIGNKESITRDKLLDFIKKLYENGMG
ncbi:hypothetical protein KY366_05700 [Candidatus Woesearchaeota archaeon]|nr:hypothetical protein [Candidatus Woesearchaeota archaeon]